MFIIKTSHLCDLVLFPAYKLMVKLNYLGAPGSVVGLSAVVPDGSVTILTVIWSAPAQPSGAVSQYYVIVTNYSLASVTNKNVSGDTTSTNVTDLSKSQAC